MHSLNLGVNQNCQMPSVTDFLLSFLQGKMDAAASMIEKAIIANPTYAEAYNNLGLFYFNLFCN